MTDLIRLLFTVACIQHARAVQVMQRPVVFTSHFYPDAKPQDRYAWIWHLPDRSPHQLSAGLHFTMPLWVRDICG